MKKIINTVIFKNTLSIVLTIIIVLTILLMLNVSKYYFFPLFIPIYYIIYNLFIKNITINSLKLRSILFIIVAILFSVTINSSRLFGHEIITITPSVSKINSQTNEVWVCGIKASAARISIVSNNEWKEMDGCEVYIGANKSPLVLDVSNSDEVHLNFVHHPYSAAAVVSTNMGDEYIDLYTTDATTIQYNVNVSNTSNASFINISITILFAILLTIVLWGISNYNSKIASYVIASICISNVLFFTMSDRVIATILCLIYMLCAYFGINNFMPIYKTFNKLEKFLFYFISFIINILSFGAVLFLSKSSVPFYCDLMSILLFIQSFAIIICIEISIIKLFEIISAYLIKKNSSKKKKNYLFFILSFASLFIWSIAFYPGNLSVDSIVQLASIVNSSITDAIPPIMTIIVSAIFKLTNNIFYYVLLQDLFFALMVSKIFNYLYKKGFNKITLIVLSILIPMLPNIAVTNATVWKDIIYSIALTMLSYYTYRIIIKDDKEIYNVGDIILFIISFIFTKEFRHNGLVPFVLESLMLVYISFNRRNKKLFLITIASIVLSTSGLNILYNIYDVQHISLGGNVYNNVVRDFAATIYYEKELSDEAYELIKPIGDMEHFKKYYNPVNIDYLFYNSPDSDKKWVETVNSYKPTKVLPIYIKNVIKNPDVFIRDRYDSMAIMFDASYSNRYDSFFAYFDGICEINNETIEESISNAKNLKKTENGYISDSKLSNFFRKIIFFTIENIILVQICWKSGIFFIGYLILFFYLIIKKKPLFILGMTPIIGNTLSWFLVLNHPSVRYVYYLNMSFIFMLLLSLVAIKEAKK